MTAVNFNNDNNSFLYFNNNVSDFIENYYRYNFDFYNSSDDCVSNNIDCKSNSNFSSLPDTGFREAVEKRIKDNPLVVLEIIGLCSLILATVFGNALVVLSVFRSKCTCCGLCPNESTYRAPPSHYLIGSMAGADLLLGLFVLPLSGAREIAREWYMGKSLCSFWTTLDVLSCTASIISLCAVAIDRYIGVSRPLSYARLVTKKKTKIFIGVIWFVSLLICLGPPLGWNDQKATVPVGGHYVPRSMHRHHTGADCHVNKQLGYVIFSATGSFYIPACIIIVLYWLIYRVARKHAEDLRKGQYIGNSEVTLRVHQGGYSSDTQSMMSMSSSLNVSSTQDMSIQQAPANDPPMQRVNSFASQVISDVNITSTTGRMSLDNNKSVTPARQRYTSIGDMKKLSVIKCQDRDDEVFDKNELTVVNENVPVTPIRKLSVKDGESCKKTVRKRLVSSTSDVLVNKPLTTVVNKNVTRVKNEVACVMSPRGNHLMPFAFNPLSKIQTPLKRQQDGIINATPIQSVKSTDARNSIASNKSFKSNRSFREKYLAGSVFAKEAKYRRQLKAAKTLGIVVGTFLVCWSPFFLLLPIEAACPNCDLKIIFNIAIWMGYLNSCLNPLIYACSSRDLRRSFKRVLCPRMDRKRKCRNNLV